MRKLLREPLIHFLALGAILFAIGLARDDPTGPSTNRITLTPGVIERLLAGFRLTWQRPPTEPEFRGLVEEYLKEEVLYREAIEMGLDRNDQIIRRRMRQKLDFLTADLVDSIEPSQEELQAYLDANKDRYRQDAMLRFTQIYFGEQTGSREDALDRARAALGDLRASPGRNPETLGDPFLYPLAQGELSERALMGMFGEEFSSQVVVLPVGEWSGPVTSAFGAHVVRLDTFQAGRESQLSEVRDAVYRDLTSERTRQAEQAFFESLLAQYTVTVEWPEGMEPVAIPGVTE